MKKKPDVEVINLRKSFKYHKKETGIMGSVKNIFFRETLVKDAVKGVTFSISDGELVGLLGSNGAGKTTILKMLSGILYPSGGSANILGYTPWERKKHFKMQFSIAMGQKNQLWWDLPANESLYMNKCIYEIEDAEYYKTIDELSELLDVKHLLKIQVRRLSLGERMKIELIAALMHKPKILFLDEPTIGLDIISQKKVREFIKHYNIQNSTTTMLTSHNMSDIRDLCKRVIIINSGQIAYDGQLSEINEITSGKKLIKLQFDKNVSKSTLDRLGVVIEYNGSNAVIEVNKPNVIELSKVILDSLPVIDLNIEDMPIEEGVEHIYRRKYEPNG